MPLACPSWLSTLHGVAYPLWRGGAGPGSQELPAFPPAADPLLPGTLEVESPGKAGFRLYFPQLGSGALKALGLCRGDAVGTQPRRPSLGWATAPQPLWLLAAHSCPLLQGIAPARQEMAHLGGDHLLVPHRPGRPPDNN